ncbi:PLP-dependent aminotransferase family protein [Desulfocurvus vexinensis]|uniref:aminotransferase-like domain-containing protein n=1 Tax=Desulfocurvus vexinensis TaxID=399548 RepID=UPI000557B6FC|nr:PLP-dependent aminotransferase family protein [Desulfocurvus vexinensis]
MSLPFAARMGSVHRSFIREILKVTADPEVISFAGGLPNPGLFPMRELAEAAAQVIGQEGRSTLQYSTTEGHAPLREWIAARYRERKGLDVGADDILVTTGSQQALDLMGKVLIDKGDRVLMEAPGYLGAIQAFSVFQPEFRTVPLEDDGPDLEVLARELAGGVKAFYAVTNFQNPSGLTYGPAKRRAVADLLAGTDVFFAEDDPYGELRFEGQDQPPVYALRPENSVLTGSFSKVCAPGFRIGWIVARGPLRDALVRVKQASDLHTSTVTQRIVHRYLETNDLDAHIARIRQCYGEQCRAMQEAAARHLPPEVRLTRAEGGMFLWAVMPEGYSSMELFERAIRCKVAFVPGRPFYVDGSGDNTMRLNYTNSEPERIEEGMRRLGRCLEEYLAARGGERAACAAQARP